jgi:hypothetical protein
LPEWTEYDNEIRRVLEKVAGNKLKPDEEDESKRKKTENQKLENDEGNDIDDDHKKHSEL